MTTLKAIKMIARRLAVFVAGSLALGAMAFASPVWASEAFNVEAFENSIVNEQGQPVTQAGAHPYAMTTKIVFNRHEVEKFGEIRFAPEGDPKNIEVNLPVGLVVDPTATGARCTEAQLEHEGDCPSASAVGVVEVDSYRLGTELVSPLFNMMPRPGVPAELGLNIAGSGYVVHLQGKVRTGGDYGLSADVSNITQQVGIWGTKLTLWGNPSAMSHDNERGRCAHANKKEKEREESEYKEAIKEGKTVNEEEYRFNCPVQSGGRPLLTLPGACTGVPLQATMSADSWQEPERLVQPPPAESAAVTGCERLDFSPSISVMTEPEGVAADSPTGLSVNLKVPQEQGVLGLAESNLKEAVVGLPAGMAVSPSAANGLGACTPEEIGLNSASASSCPDSSKLGSVEIETPLLEDPLKGAVFVAQQGNLLGNGSNPFGSLLALYIVAEADGALVKLPGEVSLDPVTGQLTARFGEDPLTTLSTGERQFLPQLPFSDLKMSFFAGPKAPLITPPGCGTYTTTSRLTPWSGGAPAEPSSSFTISQGCATGGFAPSFTAGTSNNQAGGFSPFSVTFSRQDGEQRLGGAQIVAPPGLLGILKGVAQCPEPQASQGECGPESEIGETTVAAGPGEDPYWVKGGRVYLTGPYEGAPFGLSIVVPAVAGPFNLGIEGKPVVVRAQISVNPHTAQITVTSDPLPTILQGVPLDIRRVNVTVNRSGFMFNPTSCLPSSVTGTLGSTSGASAPVSSPFEAASCAALPFKPSFTVSTQAKTSKAKGAGLTIKVAQKPGEANIHNVDLTLPKVLPSRLTTLQKACTEAQFNANPAGCPEGSFIGTATAHTPVLNVPLTGPAILVSHGGAEFPDVEFLLQGEGVEILLDGKTDIKGGITYSKFETVPDAPISSFETSLPEGPHSVLTTEKPGSTNLCAHDLTMPTAFTGQNGAEIHQSTAIAVEGCSTTLSFTSSIKKESLTLSVYAPAAGKLRASGKGLTTVSKTAKGHEDVTITLKQKKAGKFKTAVKIVFSPSTGKVRKKQSKSAKVTFKK